MILNKLRHRGIRRRLRRTALKIDLLGKRTIRADQLHRLRQTRAEKRAIAQVKAGVDFVPSVPARFCKLVCRKQLHFFPSPRPPVEEIALQSFRRDQHGRQSLAVGIAVESRVLRNRA